MLPFLTAYIVAQAQPAPPPAPQVIQQPQVVRPLNGGLDEVLVFNSNSPEVVQTEGILLSTFPPEGKAVPSAHLNQQLNGRFDVFAHHIAKATPDDLKTLYFGVLLHNPGSTSVTVNVLQAASHLSQPDAPFIQLPAVVENPQGTVFAGPGDRIANDVLRGQRQPGWPAQIMIPAGQSRMLLNVPIPVKELTPPVNGRSTLARLYSTGPLYAASLARFAPQDETGAERAPTLAEWETLLKSAPLAGPRDKRPSKPDDLTQLVYGRVAGVARGAQWRAQLSDLASGGYRLQIPQPGQAFSYGISTVDRGTFGSGQVQTAPLLVRYPDTAYSAHGNYGVQYSLSLPLHNPTDQIQTVTVTFQSALKTDRAEDTLQFYDPPPQSVFFRGTVRVRYQDDQGNPRSRYVHQVHLQGQQSEPLVRLKLAPQDTRLVQIDLIYPPDAKPPQVLTVATLTPSQGSAR